MTAKRSIGLLGIAGVALLSGAATLVRATYVTTPAWRVVIAAVVLAIGLLTAVAAIRKRPR